MRFIKIRARRAHLGRTTNEPDAAQDRLVAFGPGYVIELRDKAMTSSTDPTVTLLDIHFAGNASGPTDSGHYEVEDITAAKFAAQVEAATEPAAGSPSAAAFPIKWRGQWESGEAYKTWDAVAHPDDSTRRLIALEDNQSTSVLALANSRFWADLPKASQPATAFLGNLPIGLHG